MRLQKQLTKFLGLVSYVCFVDAILTMQKL